MNHVSQLSLLGAQASALPNSQRYVEAWAEISECGQYRYRLRRVWDEALPSLLVVSLNPSTAAGENDQAALFGRRDDPTLRRDVGFAKAWGYGGLWLGNVFGFRSTNPAALATIRDPVGPENDARLRWMADNSAFTLVGWGAHARARQRAEHVLALLASVRQVHCLGRTKDGSPRHPLYAKADCKPEAYP